MSQLNAFDAADFIEIDAFPQHSSVSRHSLVLQQPRVQHGFCCILSGNFVYEENGSTLRAGEGDIVYLKEGARYHVTSYKTDRPAADILLNFRVRKELSYSPWNCIAAHDSTGEITAAFGKLSALCAHDAGMLQKKAALYTILCALVPPERVPDEALGKIRLLLEDPTCRLTDAALAECCSMSISTLQRRFLSAYGKTLSEYRLSVKIAAAKEYLLTDQYTVGEIAGLLGYCDTSYFCRHFKRETGFTPLHYVKEKQGG